MQRSRVASAVVEKRKLGGRRRTISLVGWALVLLLLGGVGLVSMIRSHSVDGPHHHIEKKRSGHTEPEQYRRNREVSTGAVHPPRRHKLGSALDDLVHAGQDTSHPRNEGAEVPEMRLKAPSLATHNREIHPSKNNNKMRKNERRSTLRTKSQHRLCYRAHAFYYAWYDSPKFSRNERYVHWNHPFMPHWDKEVTEKYPHGRHHPPEDLGSSFFPKLGAYSSRDPNVIREHMEYFVRAGIGTLVLSWYPPGKADENGLPSDSLVPQLLDAADEVGVKVAFHSEPYSSRTEKTLLEDIKYIVKKYGDHPALLRVQRSRYVKSRQECFSSRSSTGTTKGDLLPVIYVYDAYHVEPEKWASLFQPGGALSIRGTRYDAVAIALQLEDTDADKYIGVGGFDATYNYFASDRFTYASAWSNWRVLSKIISSGHPSGSVATTTAQLPSFIPSVGPGYNDAKVRPWNGENTKSREQGHYYNKSFTSAISALKEGSLALEHHKQRETKAGHQQDVSSRCRDLDIISITSFNEWHEGTQIEPAVAHEPTDPDGVEAQMERRGELWETGAYEAYVGPHSPSSDPYLYLDLTRHWIDEFCWEDN